MKLQNFLEKECPDQGGCMLCHTTYEGKDEFLLVERVHTSYDDMFLINKKFFYDYDFLWNNNWEILYKKES